jgi:hypothetical protein
VFDVIPQCLVRFCVTFCNCFSCRSSSYNSFVGADCTRVFSVCAFLLFVHHETCEFSTYLDEAVQTQFINIWSRIKENIEEGSETFQALVGKAASYELK